jgi:hypothetical protein
MPKEDLATKEDLQVIVDQVRATTKVTEGIKAKLSGKLFVSRERTGEPQS